jgi:hypothetical protein
VAAFIAQPAKNMILSELPGSLQALHPYVQDTRHRFDTSIPFIFVLKFRIMGLNMEHHNFNSVLTKYITTLSSMQIFIPEKFSPAGDHT